MGEPVYPCPLRMGDLLRTLCPQVTGSSAISWPVRSFHQVTTDPPGRSVSGTSVDTRWNKRRVVLVCSSDGSGRLGHLTVEEGRHDLERRLWRLVVLHTEGVDAHDDQDFPGPLHPYCAVHT